MTPSLTGMQMINGNKYNLEVFSSLGYWTFREMKDEGWEEFLEKSIPSTNPNSLRPEQVSDRLFRSLNELCSMKWLTSSSYDIKWRRKFLKKWTWCRTSIELVCLLSLWSHESMLWKWRHGWHDLCDDTTLDLSPSHHPPPAWEREQWTGIVRGVTFSLIPSFIIIYSFILIFLKFATGTRRTESGKTR